MYIKPMTDTDTYTTPDEQDEIELNVGVIEAEEFHNSIEMSHEEFDEVIGSLGVDIHQGYQSEDFGFDEENFG